MEQSSIFNLNRREFVSLGGAALASAAVRESPLLMITRDQADSMRRLLDKDSQIASPIRRSVDLAMTAGPWSVTFHRPPAGRADAGPNDYYSEAPYWWPDPANPAGPYIRRDGERNPQRFVDNRRDLGNMSQAVLALGMGARLFGDARCGPRAKTVLSTWFIDPKTRMKPNLEFGQAVRGVNTGRGTGQIETVSLIQAAQGIALLEDAGSLGPEIGPGLRRWFGDYLDWMVTSVKGYGEKRATNNHATWWTSQVAAFATLTRDTNARRMAWERYQTYLLPTEVQPDGSCPREEARTQSLSYSAMNLDGFSVLCTLAGRDGVDLWHYRTPDGIGIEKAFLYLIPYVLQPATWGKQQITKFDPAGVLFPALAGVGLPSPELLAHYRRLPRSNAPWVRFVDLMVRTA